jgi:hypothetical protein
MDTLYNSPNMTKSTVSDELSSEQRPLGTKFQSYNLNQAVNYYTLDPFQYSITKFDFNENNRKTQESTMEFKNDPGLIYKGVDFEKILPNFTQTKKSVNDFRAQDYHRFQANEGYFDPKINPDLWYYGAAKNAQMNKSGVAGAQLNVQEINHIIFPEPQRGGLNSQNLAKYSWSNYNEKADFAGNCKFFDYNSNNRGKVNDAYLFDSNYCRNIGISDQYQGSMPFNPEKIN